MELYFWLADKRLQSEHPGYPDHDGCDSKVVAAARSLPENPTRRHRAAPAGKL